MSKSSAKTTPALTVADNIIEELWFGDVDESGPEDQAAQSFAAALARSKGLKPFPAIAQQVLSVTRSINYDPRQLAKVISSDPALSAAFMRVANSAMYRGARACKSVAEGVVRLGMNTVRDIAVGITTMGLFSDIKGYGKTVRNHSVVTAALCRVLADEWRLRAADAAMLVGLLHDIGKLLILQTGDCMYDEAPPEVCDAPDAIHLYERESTGYDHAVLGAHVLEFWQLPHDIVQAVAWHHQPGRAYDLGGNVAVTVAVLRLADRIEYQLRDGGKIDEVFAEAAAKSGEASYLSFSAADLLELNDKLCAVRDESKSLFV